MNMFLRSSICGLVLSLAASCGSDSKGKSTTPPAPWQPTATGPEIPSSALPGPTTSTSPTTIPAPIAPLTTPLSGATTLANVPLMGTPTTLEIGTWNIENYPKSSRSKSMVSKILNQMDVDVMAVEEISSKAAFQELLTEMPNFTGLLADDSIQNVGFIYRKADFRLASSEVLFTRDNYAFPRPALMVRLDPVQEGRPDIVAIAVHLKAFGDDTSQERREAANLQLYEYVASLKAKEPDLRVIVLGDFNQPIVEPASRRAFNPWFERASTYTVHTDALVKRGDYSYFSQGRLSLIDHMITSNDFLIDDPIIPKLQTIVPNYEAEASDHLPVIARVR